MVLPLRHVVIDCRDPSRLAPFWGKLLGARAGDIDEDWSVVEARPLLLVFQRVPEAKPGPKNRLHLDLLSRNAAADADRAEALGARIVTPFVATDGGGYVVLQDPEGNEFCLIVDEGDVWERRMKQSLTLQ